MKIKCDNEEKEELDFYKSIPMPDDIFEEILDNKKRIIWK